MQPRKTNTYEVFPTSPKPPVKEPESEAASSSEEGHLDPNRLPEPDRALLSACWELATQYKDHGRNSEAVEYFLVAAALFERAGQVPKPIYRVVLELDPDNALAASRLESDGVTGARAALFVQHVLSRHERNQILKVLDDEKRRNWVTPPRGSQRTCPDCGMGIPDGQDYCSFCGATLENGYKKHPTAAYKIPHKAQTLPRGIPVRPAQPASPRQDDSPDEAEAPSVPFQEPEAQKGPDAAPSPQGVVRVLDINGEPLAKGLVGPQGLWIGSGQGALGEGVANLPEKMVHLAFSDSGFTYRSQPDFPVYRVMHGSAPCTEKQLVQAGRHLFRLATKENHIEVSVLSPQDGTAITVCRFPSQAVTIGRNGNDLDLPQDDYLADHHLEITLDDKGMLTMTDLDTESGTFLAMPQQGSAAADMVLRVQDFFLVLTVPD